MTFIQRLLFNKRKLNVSLYHQIWLHLVADYINGVLNINIKIS